MTLEPSRLLDEPGNWTRIGFPGLDEAKPDVVIDLFGSANALKLATHEICMIVEAEVSKTVVCTQLSK
jgi:hypothetical protein